MKKFEKMDKREKKELLISTAEEIQEVCVFEPPIKTARKTENQLIEILKDAAADLTPDDELSDIAISVLTAIGASGASFPEPELEEEPEEEVEEPQMKVHKNKKEEGQITMASFLDQLIEKGGSWKVLCRKAQEENDRRGGKTKYTESTFRAHIKFRLSKDPKWLKNFGVTLTEKGIEK